jgi:hypothetical protein
MAIKCIFRSKNAGKSEKFYNPHDLWAEAWIQTSAFGFAFSSNIFRKAMSISLSPTGSTFSAMYAPDIFDCTELVGQLILRQKSDNLVDGSSITGVIIHRSPLLLVLS